MTPHYFACTAPPGAPEPIPPALARLLQQQGLVPRACPAGWRLHATERLEVRPMADRTGFLVGTLFEPSGAPAAPTPSGQVSAAGAADLTRRYWGAYVGLGGDPARPRILRDPSGALACYHAARGSGHCLTSLPHLLVDAEIVARELDWATIQATLTRQDERNRNTAIRRISEVLPGQLVALGNGRWDEQPAWDPWVHAARLAPADAAQQLEAILCSTLRAWTGLYRRPLVEISGGLDSAIVAAAASAAGADLALITFAAAQGDPDETGYARAIADHLGLPLEIVHPRIEAVDLGRSSSRDLPRPNARAFTQAADAESLRHARAINADAFLSGGGGDDVFCYQRTILPALDRFEAEGVRAMGRTALDIAVMDHATIWDALFRIAKRLVRGGSALPPADLRFLRRDGASIAMPGRTRDRDRRAPRGKAEHVRAVLTIHNHLEGHERLAFAPILSPLLSQPVVEHCLSITSWCWCEGGENRSVARQAFAGRLPRLVIERRSKGTFDAFSARLLEANRSLLLDMLVDGQLVGSGIVDRNQIIEALRSPSLSGDQVGRLLAIANVESWCRSWISRVAPASSPTPV